MALLASGNVVVYAVGSAFKTLDGSMVAGAKCASSKPPLPLQCPQNYRVCTPGDWYCVGSSWIYQPADCARNGPIYDDCM